MAEPPVTETRLRMPINFSLLTVNNARSLFGTRMRGGRWLFLGTYNFFTMNVAWRAQADGSMLLSAKHILDTDTGLRQERPTDLLVAYDRRQRGKYRVGEFVGPCCRLSAIARSWSFAI